MQIRIKRGVSRIAAYALLRSFVHQSPYFTSLSAEEHILCRACIRLSSSCPILSAVLGFLSFFSYFLPVSPFIYSPAYILPLHLAPNPAESHRPGVTLSSAIRGEIIADSLMSEASLFDRMMVHLRETCRYYTGFPKYSGPSRVIHFTSEREFVQILHQGYPVVVAFTIRGNYTEHLDRVLEEAAAEFYPHVKFMRVECPKYPGFCMTRQRKEYPFIEIFHNPEQVANQGRGADPNISKYSVKVLPFNYDVSAYGFREFFKRYGIQTSSQK